MLATASYRLYADAIAERLGFDDVIGTGSFIGLDERVHAKIAGENCYGPAKLRMIADWVERQGLKGEHGHVRFYSDHVSDQPAFEWADEPVAVNPHGKLRRLAEHERLAGARLARTGGPRPRSARCAKSAIRSSGSSTPIEMRTRLSVMPSACLRSSGTDKWVIAAGALASVSVPPRLTARWAILSASRKANASFSPPFR